MTQLILYENKMKKKYKNRTASYNLYTIKNNNKMYLMLKRNAFKYILM